MCVFALEISSFRNVFRTLFIVHLIVTTVCVYVFDENIFARSQREIGVSGGNYTLLPAYVKSVILWPFSTADPLK